MIRTPAVAFLALFLLADSLLAEEEYRIDRVIAHEGFDGKSCWVHARAGAIPADSEDGKPTVVMTMQKLLLEGSDIFYRLHELRSEDLGDTWSRPKPIDSFQRETVVSGEPLPTGGGIASELLQLGDETTVCDFTPEWHAASETLLGTGHTVWYRNNRVMKVRPRGIAYATLDAETSAWNPWKVMATPAEPKFRNAGAGSVQRLDLPDGDVLLPIYYKATEEKQYLVTVVRCSFDGAVLTWEEHGNEMTVPVQRGFAEPSMARVGNRFFLTLRNDEAGYVTASSDGMKYEEPRKWTFDDGQDLGNYNTQQHWVTQGTDLYLVYTRRGADNDHVFRHRAPLFMAKVDQEHLCVIRDTERILVPEYGARLGNFAVTEISETETWITVTEWMQPVGVEKHGSNNRVWVARLRW